VYCYINGGLLNGYRYIIDFAATSATPHAHMARKGHADWETAHHVFTYANALDQMLKRIGTTDSDKDVAAVRGVLHGAMALYLTRDLNVPPARLPGEGSEQLDDLPTDPEAIRTALRLRRSVTTTADPSRRIATVREAIP
jgi:hypothetical protein